MPPDTCMAHSLPTFSFLHTHHLISEDCLNCTTWNRPTPTLRLSISLLCFLFLHNPYHYVTCYVLCIHLLIVLSTRNITSLRVDFFFLFFFRAAPVVYGSSQAGSWIRAAAASLLHSHSKARSEPHLPTYTTAHSNAGSLTHWARPEIGQHPHGY